MIALTGTTGALGGLVLDRVADLDPILIVRDASRARPGHEVRVATYGDQDACVRAFDGVETLLIVSAAESSRRREEHASVIAAAARAGVTNAVYTSFQGAADDATFTLGRDHHAAEQAIAATGMRATILRDSFYQDVLPLFADAEGAIRGPAGQGRVAAVSRVDVADVAAAVLRDPAAHAGATYTLTGPEALTLAEVAERAGAVLGHRLRFVDEPLEDAYAWRARDYGTAEEPVPQWQLDAWVSTYTAIADGSVEAVTGDVERVTGRPARTIEQTLRVGAA